LTTSVQPSQIDRFGSALVELGSINEDLVVLDPDVSASTKTSYFAERFPRRFVNAGISEQDMMGIAAGLAASGKIPVVSGFAMFTAGRAWEQIANSIASPNLNVKIVATHGGLSPHADGESHQCIGDVALMQVLPNMRVVVPADAIEAAKALEALVLSEGPAYMRLGRGAMPAVYDESYTYELGEASLVGEGDDAAVIANGVMVSLALEAADVLRGKGVGVRVLDMHTVKPIDEDAVFKAAIDTGAIVTAEEHSLLGGLGSVVASILCQRLPTPMKMVGIRDEFGESSRDYRSLLAKYGLTSGAIVDAVNLILEKRKR